MEKSITWLKGLAMLLIVVSHMYTVSGIENIYAFCDDLGRLGVIFFICISGIIYGNKPNKIKFSRDLKELLKTLKHKIEKINYRRYLLFLVIMFMLRVMFGENIKWLILELLVSIPLLQSYIPYETIFAYSLNTPMWYLSMMLIIWICTPFIKKFFDKYRNMNWIFLYVILLVIIYLLCQLDISVEWKRWIVYINPFVNLMFFALSYRFGESHKYFSKAGLLFGVCGLIIIYYCKDYVQIDFRTVLFLIPALFIVSNFFHLPYEVPEKSIILSIGKKSTSIFVTHYSICYIFRKFELFGWLPFFHVL